MKKLLTIVAVAAAPIAFAAPAHAQYYCDQICQDEARDPGYQSAVRGGRYYGGYNNNPYSAPNSNSQEDVSCVQVFIFYSKCRVKPRPMNCYGANGDMTVTDERGTRFVGGSASDRPVPRVVSTSCGGNTYESRQ